MSEIEESIAHHVRYCSIPPLTPVGGRVWDVELLYPTLREKARLDDVDVADNLGWNDIRVDTTSWLCFVWRCDTRRNRGSEDMVVL